MVDVISGIIIRDNKLLVVNNRGTWSPPSGTKEEDESEIECLLREIQVEELPGTRIAVLGFYRRFSGVSPRTRTSIDLWAYHCRLIGEVGAPDGRDDDIQGYAWSKGYDNRPYTDLTRHIYASLRADGHLGPTT